MNPEYVERLERMIATARALEPDEDKALWMVSAMAEAVALGGGPRQNFRPVVRALAGKEPRLLTTG